MATNMTRLCIFQTLLNLASFGLCAPYYSKSAAWSPWTEDPVVKVKNGSYVGLHSETYQQDFFLGVPFAQPPLGNLRFANPAALNIAWEGTRDAKTYSPECVGYGSSQMGYQISEDCLYLNVIRPSNVKGPLPVAVWIYGGGWVQGGAPDLRYNMSFIVNRSVEIGEPIMAVSINYRLSAWGFLGSDEVKASGNSNFGLRDQRLALHWISENIAAFGGDRSKVTIWGQSAGAASVGYHLLAFNGRDNGLFCSAIMESGGPLALGAETSSTQALYNNLTKATGCATADSLACLRALPFEELNSVINTTAFSGGWGPKIDGDLVARHSSDQLADGSFVHVPIIIGANSDEGTSLAPKGLSTPEEFKQYLTTSEDLPDDFAGQIIQAYPNDSNVEVLQNLPPSFVPNATYGSEYRRAATYAGDQVFIAGRRLTCQTWAGAHLRAYCYRFNAVPAWVTQMDGATHFVEVAFAMYNIDGVGYPPVREPPFEGKSERYTQLAELMSGDWASFVATGSPDTWKDRTDYDVPVWPAYGTNEGANLNFVYDANVTSHLEIDDFRKEGINLILSGSLDVYDR